MTKRNHQDTKGTKGCTKEVSWCLGGSAFRQACLALVLFTPAAAHDLLEGHLRQVRAIHSASERPVSFPELRRLRPARVVAAPPRKAPGRAVASKLARSVSLPELMDLAAQRSPEVLAAYQAWRATLRQYEQASYLEDLLSRYRSFVRELDTRVGPQPHRPMNFVFPSSLALKGQLVDVAAGVARLRYEQAARKARNQAARSFLDVRLQRRSLAILRESRELFADMEQLTLSQFKVGNVSQADSLKAQSQLADLDNQVYGLERQVASSIAAANVLLDIPAESPWGPLVALEPLPIRHPTLASAIAASARSNQDVLIARLEADQASVSTRLAETMLYPRGSAGFSQLALGAGAEAGPTRSEMAAFPARFEPDPARGTFGSQAAYVDELRVRIGQSARMAEAAALTAASAVQAAFYQLEAGRRSLETYAGTIVPKARQSFQTMRERYNAFKAPFIEYLDAGRTFLEAATKEAQALRDRDRAVVDLEDAIGHAALHSRQEEP